MKTILLSLLASGLCTSSALAAGLGEQCELTSDCDTGLACEVVGASGCAPCPDDGSECPDCETTEERACVPGSCQDDGDCSDGYVCFTYEEPCATTEPACDPDSESCAPRDDESDACEAESVSVCAPKWILPCENDAACGEGFTCEAEEVCTCSGSGGSDTPYPGDPDDDGSEFVPPDDDENCDCQPSGDKYCHPKEIACEADDACPTGWTCEAGDSATTNCAAPEGEEPNCEPEQSEPGPSYCYPPGAAFAGSDGGGKDVGEELGIPTNEHSDGDSNPQDPGTPRSATGEPSGGCNGAPVPLAMVLVALAFVSRRARYAKVK